MVEGGIGANSGLAGVLVVGTYPLLGRLLNDEQPATMKGRATAPAKSS